MSATRVLASVQVDPAFGCWLVTDKLDKDGYALCWRGKRPSYAHRVVYEQLVGPVDDGKVLDHRCKVRACVRPSHLDVVTQRENLLRRPWKAKVREKVCPKGHDMALLAIATPRGGRVCRECNKGEL